MNRIIKALLVIGLLGSIRAEERSGVEIPFADPARRMSMHIEIVSDEAVSILGYDGKTVIVEPQGRSGKPEGSLADLGVIARERDNVLTLRLNASKGLSLRVPRNASLQITCRQDGNVEVEDVDGEIEATGRNGSISVSGGTGSVVAASQDGRITARFGMLPAAKLISLRNLDGTIELSLPPDAKASVTLESQDGRVHSDFALGEASAGKSRERRLVGKLNGGGAEVHLSTHDGTVNLKAEKPVGTNAPTSKPADPKSK